MPAIKARKQADGTLRYTAVVRIRKQGAILYQEAQTFTHRSAALRWGKHREVALEQPGALIQIQQGATTLAELVGWYIEKFEKISVWQRAKQAGLKYLQKHPIGKTNALTLTSAALVDHIRSRRAGGAGPATVANDLIWIGVVLRAAKSVRQLPVKPEIVEEARNACRELRLIGKSRRRERRFTDDELKKLKEYFGRRDRRSDMPMNDILDFALETARREAEICRIEWKDNDDATRTGMVRDAKHPRAKIGNHRRFKYTPEAWAIAQRQPKTSQFIFPYNPRTVSANFTRACHMLGIEDLHFHDGRHEATSRLFERGYAIQEVAQFTLHESWNELKRYTHLKPEKIRDLPAEPRAEAPDATSAQFHSGHRALTSARPSGAARRSARRGQPRSPATVISDHPA